MDRIDKEMLCCFIAAPIVFIGLCWIIGKADPKSTGAAIIRFLQKLIAEDGTSILFWIIAAFAAATLAIRWINSPPRQPPFQ